MKSYSLHDLKVTLERKGARKYTKASYPIRYGCFSEIERGGFRYLFNRNGEIRRIEGIKPDWPHPAEWLKRTIGNDWVYYSTGSYYSGVFDLFGEYYLPCPAYPTNSLFREKPFARTCVAAALHEFAEISPHVLRLVEKWPGREVRELKDFLSLVGNCSAAGLHKRADHLHRILQARVSVLPPDCRHVDYDVLPLMIADGCLYNCAFCEVKTGIDLSCRTRSAIAEQLLSLKEYFGPDLANYNSVYLGQHDALAADPDDIIFAAERAYAILDLNKSYMEEPRLFLFGSGASFLAMQDNFWDDVNRLPYYTYVNLGLESFDDNTLEFLKKPVSSGETARAFQRMLEINREYANMEVTANFVLGENLPAGHIDLLCKYLGEGLPGLGSRGCIYISPLKGSRKSRELLQQFSEIKRRSRIETLLYLIQRL